MKSFLLLAFAFLLLISNSTTAQTKPKYMLLYGGMNFYCLDELPYTISRDMLWDAENGFSEVEGRPSRVAYVVEVTDCNLDIIYSQDDFYFTWRFSSHNTDGHENHRHITRGAYWIDWNGE